MSDWYFDSPVYVKDAGRLVRQIQSVSDASDFLNEWPGDGMCSRLRRRHFTRHMMDGCREQRHGTHSRRGQGRPACSRMPWSCGLDDRAEAGQ